MGAMAFIYQAAVLPEKAARAVYQRIALACLHAPECIAPVEGAIATCAGTQLRWQSLIPGRYTSQNHRDPIRGWSALVDCLNHAAGEVHFHLSAADTIITDEMLDALK